MRTMTKVKTITKQKVMLAVGVVAVLAATVGFFAAIGKSMGFGFGYPFRRTATEQGNGTGSSGEKTMLPAYNTYVKTRTPVKTSPVKTSTPVKKTAPVQGVK